VRGALPDELQREANDAHLRRSARERQSAAQYLEAQAQCIDTTTYVAVRDHAAQQSQRTWTQLNQVKSKQTKSKQIETNQIKANQPKPSNHSEHGPSEIKSNQIKSNQGKSTKNFKCNIEVRQSRTPNT
jgi:S-methylmethionine-dependent homocysteine/selenocysteine methylase